MKVAAYQAPLLPTPLTGIIGLIRKQVEWCAASGIEVLCCPEAVLGGLADDADDPAAIALSIDDGTVETLLAPITHPSVIVIVGLTEAGNDGRLYNSAVILRGGRIAGVYRKRHPAMRHSVYAPGVVSPVFDFAAVPFGIMICNDSNYPELAREMAGRGARLIFVPSNNALPPKRADVVAATRAVDQSLASDNRVALVRADVAGRTNRFVSFGTSAITDARGALVCGATPLQEDLLVAEIDDVS